MLPGRLGIITRVVGLLSLDDARAWLTSRPRDVRDPGPDDDPDGSWRGVDAVLGFVLRGWLDGTARSIGITRVTALPTRGAQVLELARLTRRFGDLVALDALSFEVQPGQMFGFVGSNGAGKTTAMRIVMGVDAPDDGEVRWNGAPLDRHVRSRFGYMPEERGLYPKTPALRQLTYLARLHGLSKQAGAAQGRALLETFGLGDRVDDPVEKLSLGNQQRVQLAAALVHDPVLLVLDEPFSGLDPVGVDALSEVLLERARQGVPVVFSSHQLELVERLCDAVAIIHAGELVASGPVDELRRRRRQRVVRVDVNAPPGIDWTAGLGGIEIIHQGPDGDLLELADDVDDQLVLAAAQAAGRIRHFGAVRPSLTELYREVVQRPATEEVSR